MMCHIRHGMPGMWRMLIRRASVLSGNQLGIQDADAA